MSRFPQGDERRHLQAAARYAGEHGLTKQALGLYERTGDFAVGGLVARNAGMHDDSIRFFEKGSLVGQAVKTAIQAGYQPADIVDIYRRNGLVQHALEAAEKHGLHDLVLQIHQDQAALAATKARMSRGY